MRRLARTLPSMTVLVCAGAFVALLIFGIARPTTDQSIEQAIADGKPLPAPRFHLQSLQNGSPGKDLDDLLQAASRRGRLDSRHLRGTTYVLNFWASWCKACEEEAAALKQAWRESRSRGILFLGVDVQDSTVGAHRFLRRHAVDFPVVRDPGGDQLARYGVTALPETFVVDSRGRVVSHIIGVASLGGLRKALQAVQG